MEEKTKSPVLAAASAIYWLLVTAIFLCLCFSGIAYKISGLIWPVAGVLFLVVFIVTKLFEKK